MPLGPRVSPQKLSPRWGKYNPIFSGGSPYGLTGLQAKYDLSYPASSSSDYIRIDSSNRVSLLADTSGNSATNVLALSGATSNTCTFTALTAFGTGNFTVSGKITVLSLAALGHLWGSDDNGLSFRYNTNGTLQTAKANVAANTASTGTIAAFQTAVLTYTRSGTTGTYYIDGVAAGTITDNQDYSVGLSQIGSASTTKVNGPVGNIWWVRAYNVALNASQVAADAAGTAQSNCVVEVDFSTAAKLASSFTSGTGGGASAKTITIATTGATGARICGARDLYQGTTASQPIYLQWAGTNYGYLRGASGNYYHSPDSASSSITGDIDIRLYMAMNDWTPSGNQCPISKYTAAGTRSYILEIRTDGKPEFSWSADGTAVITKTATAAPTVSDYSALWVRVTLDVDDGAGNNVVTYYTSTDGSTWSPLGTPVTTVGTTSIHDNTANLNVGSYNNGAASLFAGKIYRAQIYAGLTGTDLRADFNPALYTSGTTFTASTGEVWTLNGGSTIVTRTCLYFDGSDDYMKAASFSLSQPESVYFTGQQVSFTDGDTLWDGNAQNAMRCYQKTSSPNLNFLGGVPDVAGVTIFSLRTAGVLGTIYSGASSGQRLNRGALIARTTGTTAANGFILGADGSPGNYGNQTTNEVLVYSAAHDTSTQDRVALYEGRKWRIAGV